MKAGRELDALVAEKVMGWTGVRGAFDDSFWPVGTPPENQGKGVVCGVFDIQEGVPYYSTDIADAWEVVEKMRRDGFDVSLWDKPSTVALAWDCRFVNLADERDRRIGLGETAPHAICLAALKVKP